MIRTQRTDNGSMRVIGVYHIQNVVEWIKHHIGCLSLLHHQNRRVPSQLPMLQRLAPSLVPASQPPLYHIQKDSRGRTDGVAIGMCVCTFNPCHVHLWGV